MSLPPHVAGPSEGSLHTYTVIFLHGRDSEAEEFACEFFESEASGPEADRTLTALFPDTQMGVSSSKSSPLRTIRYRHVTMVRHVVTPGFAST